MPGKVDEAESYVLDLQVGYLLRLANQRHAQIFAEHSLLDLTPTQFSTLIRLHEVGPCSQNQLGRLISVDVATIKGVIGRLARKGLVETNPDPSDRRRSFISLTETAASEITALLAIGRTISAKTLAPLSTGERDEFLRLLAKLT